MGWAYGRGKFKGRARPIGYSVEAKCDHKGCKERIDRGISYLCGDGLHGGMYGCGGFFCEEHLKHVEHPDEDMGTQYCKGCAAELIALYKKDGWDAEEGAPVEEDEATPAGDGG